MKTILLTSLATALGLSTLSMMSCTVGATDSHVSTTMQADSTCPPSDVPEEPEDIEIHSPHIENTCDATGLAENAKACDEDANANIDANDEVNSDSANLQALQAWVNQLRLSLVGKQSELQNAQQELEECEAAAMQAAMQQPPQQGPDCSSKEHEVECVSDEIQEINEHLQEASMKIAETQAKQHCDINEAAKTLCELARCNLEECHHEPPPPPGTGSCDCAEIDNQCPTFGEAQQACQESLFGGSDAGSGGGSTGGSGG